MYEHADQMMCPVNILIFRNQALLWTHTFDLSFKSCCRLLMSESTTADVCCFLFSNCSSRSRICARHFLFSLSRASFSVSNLSLFPHSSAFSLWSRSSCKNKWTQSFTTLFRGENQYFRQELFWVQG